MNAFSELFAAQLAAVFETGVVCSFTYHRSGAPEVSFEGVVDAFPARLSGVNPGDVRVRVRAADLAGISSPGSPDYVSDLTGVIAEVVSSTVEFGGLGVALQCRRRSSSSQAAPVGLGVPSLTRATRDALGAVSAGTLIFQTDNTPGLRVFNGANWVRFNEVVD